MDDEGIDRIFAGNFIRLPEVYKSAVRIYVCSTYTDMTLEKTTLQSEVFPKLQEYCRERYGLEFQVIDMRWGIRDDATDDHMTTRICLDEINNCQRTSVAPSFIFFGGQKYGYRPVPTFISLKEFEMITGILNEFERDTEILTDWYETDFNSVPPVMVLQPISSHFPNFLNSQVPKLQNQDQEKWWKTLCKLQETLREATYNLYKSGRLEEESYQEYQISVIEREVTEGIIKAENTKGQCLAFFRTINNINMTDKALTGGPAHFLDMENRQLNKPASMLMETLKTEKLANKLEKGNLFKYDVEWVGIAGFSAENRDKYLYKFVYDFYKSVIRLIDKAMKNTDHSARGILGQEICKHLHLCIQGNKFFYGREKELEKIKSYITGASQKCFLICGKSGSGKSFLMGKSATLIHEWISPTIPILCIRFLGSTSESSSVEQVLMSLCKQICYNLEIRLESVPDEFVPLKNFLRNLLEKASKISFIVIILDSIELFFVNFHQNGATSWLPKHLPPNIKIILSFKQDSQMTSEELTDFICGICDGEENVLRLLELGYPLALKIIQKWMFEIAKRKLTNFQWRVTMNAISVCSTPLFLRLCFSQLKSWKSYSIPEETQLPFSIEDFVTLLFDQIENKCGRVLVSRTVSYITASRNGLTESELVDILSLDDSVLHEVFTYSIPKVRRLPPILWTKIRRELKGYITEIEADGTKVIVWAHSQFRKVCSERYLTNPKFSIELHSTMADFFLARWSNGAKKPFRYSQVQLQRIGITEKESEADRKVPSQPNVFVSPNGVVSRELPFHLIKSGRFSDLAENVLFNYGWLHSKISGSPMKNVLDDFNHALSVIKDPKLHRQVFLVAGVLNLSRGILDKFPDMIGPHLIARLLPEARKHIYIKNLINQCDAECLIHNGLLPIKHSLASPGGPLKYSLDGHDFAIFGSSLTSDKRYVISISNKFISWDLDSSEVCRHVDPKTEGMMMDLAITDDNRYSATYNSANNLVIVDVIHGDYVLVPSPMEQIIGITITNEYVVIYNNFKLRTFNFYGNHIKEFEFPLQDHDILKCFYLSDSFQVTLHWNGEADMEDARIFIRSWINGKPSDFVETFNSIYFEVMSEKELVYYTCCLVEEDKEYRGVAFNYDFAIVKTRITLSDMKITKEEAVYTGKHDIFSIFIQDDVLVAVSPDTFILVFLVKFNEVKKLRLPSDLQNVRTKLNESNNCILASNEIQKHLAIAAVRKDIFVWNYDTQELLRSFNGHGGRITKMHKLCEKHHNVFVTSSADRTIKVWNVDMILEAVYPLETMDLRIESLVVFELHDLVVCRTRNRVGFWSLRTGEFESSFDNPTGNAIDGCELSHDGKYLVTVDKTNLLIWNLPSGVVLFREQIQNVRQLLKLVQSEMISVSLTEEKLDVVDEEEKPRRLYTFISRNLTNGQRCFRFQIPIKYVLNSIVTQDQNFIVTLGLDKLKLTDVLYVHHSKKGVLLHKINLKYPSFKPPLDLVSFETQYAAVIDSEKGNIFDVSGGLSILNLKTGEIHRMLIKKTMEGVFTLKCYFTKCEKYVMYYHSKRRTLRLFSCADGKMLSNYWLPSEASVITSSKSPARIIIGGIDGSITSLLIPDEDIKIAASEIKSLPSRTARCIDEKTEEELCLVGKKNPLVRFRAIVRVALLMDRIVKKNFVMGSYKKPTCSIS